RRQVLSLERLRRQGDDADGLLQIVRHDRRPLFPTVLELLQLRDVACARRRTDRLSCLVANRCGAEQDRAAFSALPHQQELLAEGCFVLQESPNDGPFGRGNDLSRGTT